MAWWEGLSPEQVRDILERQRRGMVVTLEETREWLLMEREGAQRAEAERLARRQRQMDELALDAAVVERYGSVPAGAVRYTMGIDMAEGASASGQVLVTGAHGDVATWEWTDTANTMNVLNGSNARVCEVDETCQGGKEEPPREPTLKEVWAD